MALEKIILRHKEKRFSLIVDNCNLLKKFLGLMVYKNSALLLFNFKKSRRIKIHSFFCKPFLAIYTDDKNKIQEIIKVTSWKSLILPKNKFNKLIEIPLIQKYSKITKFLLKIPLTTKKYNFTSGKNQNI